MIRTALLLLVLGGSATAGLAQTLRGTLVGTATDPSGAAIPGVAITVVNIGTNYAQDTLTNSVGNYTIPSLPVGTYTLTASFAGFQTYQVDDVVIQIGQRLRADIPLVLGNVAVVSVVAAESVVRTDDSSVGIVVSPRQIMALPNNGGLFEQLAQISPGVVTPAEGSELGRRGGFNSAGMDENSNSFFLDGFDNVDPGVRNLSFRPPLDMIQEFRIEQNSYSAEFGRNAGTVINVVSKSGANAFHGSLSNDLRNDSLDALNFFAKALDDDDKLPKPDLIRNQFAGTLGGPIVADRTFFFAAYEGLREKRGEVNRATVPTALMRQGDFSELLPATQLLDPANGFAPFAGNIIPSGDWDPIGAAVLQAYPLPNVTDPGGGVRLTGNRIEIANHIENIDTYSGRIDHQLLENTQLLGRYSFSNGRTNDPFRSDSGGGNFLSGFGQTNDITRTNVGLGLTTTIGTSMVHEFRAGYNRFRQEQIPLVALPVEQEPIAGFVEHYLNFNPLTASAIGSGRLFSRVANVFNYIDQLTWITGDHQFKFGADLRRYQFNGASAAPNQFIFVGAYTGFGPASPFPGYGVADMLLGLPFQATSFDGDPEGHTRKTEFAAYFQDDWQVTENLTLNYGIRWDWYGRITEINNEQSTWDPATNTILVAGAGIAPQLVDDDWNNFGPRFGFAWRPFGNTTTVIRGGGGIYYDSEQRQNFFQFANEPFFSTEVFRFPTPLSLANPFPGGSAPPSPNGIQQDYRDSYFEHWSLSVQHLVARDTVIEVAYIGNHGVKLNRSRNVNFFIPGVTTPPFSGWNQINLYEQAGGSIYHSLQTRIERRFFDSMGFLAAYTWGHSIDDRPVQGVASVFGFQDPLNPGADRGDSDFDVRHRFTLSIMYDLPGTNMQGVLGQVLNGWALNSIVTLQSGRPFTVYMPPQAIAGVRPDRVAGVDPVPADQGPDGWINAAAFAPPAGPLGNLGRNTHRGPGLQLVNFAAVKGFQTGEDNRLEFRAEFFNAFNRANFGLPNPLLLTPDFGLIGNTITPARQIQMGLRYDF